MVTRKRAIHYQVQINGSVSTKSINCQYVEHSETEAVKLYGTIIYWCCVVEN